MAIFALVTIVFMVYVIREHHGMLTATRLANPWLLLLAAAIHGSFWLLAATFWRFAVYVTTDKRLSMSESFRQLALVAVGKYVPGKVWGFLARGTALRQAETTTKGVFAATFVEQWAMLMSAGLVGGLLLLFTRPNQLFTVVALVAISTALFGNYLFRFGIAFFNRVLKLLTTKDDTGMATPLAYRRYVALLTMHSLMWVLIGFVLASIYYAFSLQPFSFELCAALMLANTLGIVVGFVALFAPGGLGVREAVTTAMLLPYMSLEQAAVLSIAFRVWTTSIDVLLAIMLVGQSARAAGRTYT